jgi:hypothetical protein
LIASEIVSPLSQYTSFSLISLARKLKFSFILEELMVDPDENTFGALLLSDGWASEPTKLSIVNKPSIFFIS